ncbi:MAG: hypothetical protein QNJ78_05075 [Gammaproteobacteria bacterium]|nr:hypothetical protein [Gammaproteobacteria bacterium]
MKKAMLFKTLSRLALTVGLMSARLSYAAHHMQGMGGMGGMSGMSGMAGMSGMGGMQ